MIINDTERLVKTGFDKLREESRQKLVDQVKQKQGEEKYLIDTGKDKNINTWGIPLTTELFERKMKKISPNFVFEEYTLDELKPAVQKGWPVDEPWHHKKLLWTNGTTFWYLCNYPRHVMPEWTTMWGKDEFLPNPEVISNFERPVSIKDLGSAFDPSKKVDWDAPPQHDSALYLKMRIPYGAAIRGWREVLLIAIRSKFVTLEQVEKEFGVGNSAEWAQKTRGMYKDNRPW